MSICERRYHKHVCEPLCARDLAVFADVHVCDHMSMACLVSCKVHYMCMYEVSLDVICESGCCGVQSCEGDSQHSFCGHAASVGEHQRITAEQKAFEFQALG